MSREKMLTFRVSEDQKETAYLLLKAIKKSTGKKNYQILLKALQVYNTATNNQ